MSLVEERNSISLDLESLTSFLYSYIYEDLPLSRLRAIRNRILSIPDLSLPMSRYYESKSEMLVRALKWGQDWYKVITADKLSSRESYILAENSYELTPYMAQFTFFIQSVELQGSKEQIAEWLPKIRSMEIIGSYAQTELAHGSNVRGIEIEAVYDHENQEFVINSPTATACKWWIGGLGNTSNHTLLIAQLKIKGQGYGPHAFLVPIRNTLTHVPFPGVDVGDIGPKLGLHTADNGFLRFDHYRIPKRYMLTRFSRIDEAGNYEVLDPNSIKILFLSLVQARMEIIVTAWTYLAKALTIAIRYSFVRKQFPDPDNSSTERQVIDYQIQQYKLFKPLALAYAYSIICTPLNRAYSTTAEEIQCGNSASLSYLHFIVCLYKVFVSNTTISALETTRRSCGGHGYMMISGLPTLYTNFLPKVTYDGDNSILALQAIRYLISLFEKKPPKTLRYLYGETIKPTGNPVGAHFQQQCLEAAAQYKLQGVYRKYQVLLKKNIGKEKIWNDYLQVEGIEATESVFCASVHSYFSEAVGRIENRENREAVESLRAIYAAGELERYEGVLIGLGVEAECFDLIKRESIKAFVIVRKNALGLVEAFEMRDEALNSVLGRKDGNVYENMLEQARFANPINKTKVFPGISQYFTPKI